jgi:FkbM family methyltransferase
MKHSQNDEENYIVNYFVKNSPKHGRTLLDIGAYDGMTFSNTKALLDQSWKGVMVEASPQVFTALQRNTEGLNVDLCQACIVTQPVVGMIPFWDNAGAVASNNPDHVERWKNHAEFQKIMLMPIHYKALLSTYGTEFDMVDIDIEGESANLFFEMFPLMPSVDLWVVEHDGRKQEIIDLCVGFAVLYENGENVVLGRK